MTTAPKNMTDAIIRDVTLLQRRAMADRPRRRRLEWGESNRSRSRPAPPHLEVWTDRGRI